jgi:hypothetical protein
MDGLGYDGWSRGSASLNSEDAAGESSASFSFSAPAAGRAGVMGNAHTSNLSRNARDASANNARGGKSDYDYDISLDDVDDYEGSLSAGDIRDQIPKRTSSQEPRLSQAERTQQLIQRASSERRATLSRERAARDDDTAAFSSFQDSWNELMQGLESHPASASLSRSPSISPNPTLGADVSPLRATSASSAVGRTFGSLRSPNDSDSFEISAGDFEVRRIFATISSSLNIYLCSSVCLYLCGRVLCIRMLSCSHRWARWLPGAARRRPRSAGGAGDRSTSTSAPRRAPCRQSQQR